MKIPGPTLQERSGAPPAPQAHVKEGQLDKKYSHSLTGSLHTGFGSRTYSEEALSTRCSMYGYHSENDAL